MNLLDVALLLAIASAVATGLRLGFLRRTASWIGMLAGVGVAIWTVPTALSLTRDGEPTVRLVVGLVTLALTIAVVASVFQALGTSLRRSVAGSPLSAIDRGAGAIAGALAVLAVVWFLVPAASQVPGAIARQVRGSAVVEAVTNIGPPPPDTVQALRNLVATSRFPEVFADLQPTPVTGPPPEQIPADTAVVDAATASTVNVETEGCGRRFEGSGFAAETDTIVTNAHVVAGAETVEVRRPDGSLLPATVVVFDPDRDLAVLAVAGLEQTPLERVQGSVGDLGFVVGYPGGQDTPRIAPAEIRDQRTAIGRDIYGRERTEREVLFLASDLAQGDSGAAVFDPEGRVAGVVFAISPDQAASSFALDLTELDAVLAEPRQATSTGPCI